MPAKIKMFLSNGNYSNVQPKQHINIDRERLENLTLLTATPKTSSLLNAPIISRIHNTKPGCGSCGRH